MPDDARPEVLHIANWYPNRGNPVEGIFVQDQVALFDQITHGRLVNVQVQTDPSGPLLRLHRPRYSPSARAVILRTRLPAGKAAELLTTLLLLTVLLREKVWRVDLLHIHIAYPLLIHYRLWKHLVLVPVVISEHWSAYHFNFHLPKGSPKLEGVRRIFRQGLPLLTVSQALADDIDAFSQTKQNATVIHNALSDDALSTPVSAERPRPPILFCVNLWRSVKNPFPMLDGLALAAEQGATFELVIGGFGPLLDEMKSHVAGSALAGRTTFTGKLSRSEIVDHLSRASGYLYASHYETFSVSCAEAQALGVPLIGPAIPAIAEYTSAESAVRLDDASPKGWADAATTFLSDLAAGRFNPDDIAQTARDRFDPEKIVSAYRSVLAQHARGTS